MDKEQMPAMPPGMAAGGTWSQQRVGNVVRLRYQEVKGGRTHVIGEWTEDETPAAPSVNGTGPKPARSGDRPEQGEPEPVAIDGPEPMIMLTPAAGGGVAAKRVRGGRGCGDPGAASRTGASGGQAERHHDY